MTPLLERLLAKAFHRGDVTDANAAIDAVRTERGPGTTSYEVALPSAAVDAYLTTKVLPKLIYFLDSRGQRPPQTPRTFVSLFTPEGLFFIDAGEASMVLGESLHLDAEALRKRYGVDGTGDPKLLGG